MQPEDGKTTRVRKEVWEEGMGKGAEEEEMRKQHLDHMLCQQQRGTVIPWKI